MRITHPIVLFDWQSSRKSDHPIDFLKTFSGAVITDDYQIYHKIATEKQNLKVAGCWIHARRSFADIIKSVGATNAKGTVAQEAYDMITEILHIDNDFDDLSDVVRKKQHQAKLSPKVDAYLEWTKHKCTQVGHASAIDKALAYSINQKQYLHAFLSDGNVPPDNNYAEQAIRPLPLVARITTSWRQTMVQRPVP